MDINDVLFEIVKAIIKMIFSEFQRRMDQRSSTKSKKGGDRESLDKEVAPDDESVES